MTRRVSADLVFKFGAPLDAVSGLLLKAKELKLDVIGVSFHVGSVAMIRPCTQTPSGVLAQPSTLARTSDMSSIYSNVGGGFEDALFEQAAGVLTEGH